ncbi:unnamed protein product [Rotaria magnacalcarata]|uniref:Uncharacterized protein n=3 Tax=Rotaria magnacalcarata TaxID=392030 RepID=A0A8S3EC12_9BILA|nr:unnamed protein product [Rotaria magnacalcarata]
MDNESEDSIMSTSSIEAEQEIMAKRLGKYKRIFTFSVHHEGKSAVNKHMNSDHHQSSIKASTNTTSILLPVPCATEAQKTSAVEGAFVYHGVKHGHRYVSQQCTIELRWCEKGLIDFLEDSREAALDIFKNIIKVIDDH